jgi:hypothetical protein
MIQRGHGEKRLAADSGAAGSVFKIPPNPPLSKGGTLCNHFKISPFSKGGPRAILLRVFAEDYRSIVTLQAKLNNNTCPVGGF